MEQEAVPYHVLGDVMVPEICLFRLDPGSAGSGLSEEDCESQAEGEGSAKWAGRREDPQSERVL